jgi:hypothetical protein
MILYTKRQRKTTGFEETADHSEVASAMYSREGQGIRSPKVGDAAGTSGLTFARGNA